MWFENMPNQLLLAAWVQSQSLIGLGISARVCGNHVTEGQGPSTWWCDTWYGMIIIWSIIIKIGDEGKQDVLHACIYWNYTDQLIKKPLWAQPRQDHTWCMHCPQTGPCIDVFAMLMQGKRQQGLTGKAAKWAVCQQKSHWCISEQAMMSIDAVLNTNWPLKGYFEYKFSDQKIVQTQKSWKHFENVFLDVFSPPDHNSGVHLP